MTAGIDAGRELPGPRVQGAGELAGGAHSRGSALTVADVDGPARINRSPVHERAYRRIVMPRGDRTGPEGFGPMTGWGIGFCNGSNAAGYANAPGRAFGLGRGLGYRGGRRWGAPACPPRGFWGPAYDRPPSAGERAQLLKEEIALAEQRLDALKQELDATTNEGGEEQQ
jgi:hypothetical protein